MGRNRFVCLLLVLACIGFVACGGDTPQPAADTGGDTAEEPSAEPTDQADDTGDAPTDFSQAECMKVAEAMAGAAGGMGAGADLDFDKAIAGLRRAGEAAPEAIRDDFVVFADAMAEYLTILRDGGIDFSDPSTFTTPKAQKAVKDATAVLEAPDVQEAQQNIDKGMSDVCGG